MTVEFKRMQQLRGATALWGAHNITPLDGEIAVERVAANKCKLKVGDGITPYQALPYIVADVDNLPPVLTYIGNADVTAAPPAALPGEFVTATAGGTVAASWGAPAAGTTVSAGDYLIKDKSGKWNVVSNNVEPAQRKEVVATAGQTSFTTAQPYTPGTVMVYVNGARLSQAEFAATDGTNVILANPAAAGDIVLLETFVATIATGVDSFTLADGATLQQAIAVAATPAALIASPQSLVVGSMVRTANGHLYEVAPAIAVDQHLITAGGVKLYVRDPMMNPDALGAPIKGEADASPYVEKAFSLSKSVHLLASSVYLLASIIGLPDQNIYAAQGIMLFGNGAKMVAASPLTGGTPEAIFTSAAAKLDPESTSNLYTGKVFVTGVNFTQASTSVIFNGDRIYQLEIQDNSFDGVDTPVKSFRTHAGITNGYLQSVSIRDNQFSDVRRIVDAKRAFDFDYRGNKASNCLGGVYIDGTGDPAVNSIYYVGNLFQGGGIALALGKVLAGVFVGHYGEANDQDEAATAKCDIWLKAGGGISSGLTFIGFEFQPTAAQNADSGYVSIRIDFLALGGNVPYPSLINCWTSGTRIATPGRFDIQSGIGSNSSTVMLNALVAINPAAAKRTTIGGSVTYLASTNLSGGIFRVAAIDVQYLLSMLSQAQRPVKGEISILMQHKTAGGIVNGTSHAVIGFLIMAASEGVSAGNQVDDVFATFALKDFMQIPTGAAIDTLGATVRAHFTTPALTFDRTGSVYSLRLSGYAAPSNPNYGAADRCFTHFTIEADSRNNGGNLTSPLQMSA